MQNVHTRGNLARKVPLFGQFAGRLPHLDSRRGICYNFVKIRHGYLRKVSMSQPNAPRTEVLIISRIFMTCSAIHSTIPSSMPKLSLLFLQRKIPLRIFLRKEIAHFNFFFYFCQLIIYATCAVFSSMASSVIEKPSLW